MSGERGVRSGAGLASVLGGTTPRAPGALRFVVGLTLVGALLPFSGVPVGLAYVAATTALTALHTWGLVRFRPQPAWLWRLIAACLWVLVLGDLVAVTVTPEAGEAVLAVGYVLGVGAAGVLVRLCGEREPGALLDAVLVTAIVGTVLWQASVGPVTGPDVPFAEFATRIVISALHLVSLFLVARLLTSGRVPPGLWLFTAGFVLTVIVDIATTTTGRDFVEPTWVAIIVLSRGAFAALTLTSATRDLIPDGRDVSPAPPRARVVALTVTLGGVVLPLFVAVGLEGRADLLAYVLLVPLAAGVLALRMWRILGEHERERQVLTHEADHDSLTGLANRRLVTRHIEEALSAEHGRGLAVLFCDLDGFKEVNDRLGHAAGDECLRIVARRLAGVLRPGDLLGRLGGDEFILSCRDVGTEEEAQAIARRIVDVVDQPLTIEQTEVTLRVSVGVRFSAPGVSADRLISDADAAMYTAKHSAIARRGVGTAARRLGTTGAVAVHDPLGEAIAREELRVHVQPICRLDTGRLARVEVLVRWQHPVRGLLPPADFVPLAERTGVIDQLGRWTLLGACRWLQQQRREGLAVDVAVAVNVSTRQLLGDQLVTDLVEAIEVTGVPPELLCLEITESLSVNDRRSVLVLLERVREMGVRLGVDDFGAGYSSLAALSWLPIDFVKLDRSLTTSLHAFGRERAVARAAVMLGRELGLSVVAEGVETQRQWALLRELGCDEAQGFLIGRPAPELSVAPPGWVPQDGTGLLPAHAAR